MLQKLRDLAGTPTATRFVHYFSLLQNTYDRAFSIDEIRGNTVVQWYFGASLVYFLLVFNIWIGSSITNVEEIGRAGATCWPFFKECYRLYFLHDLTVSYLRSLIFMVLYGAMVLTVWNMFRGAWQRAHFILLLMWLWEVFVVFVLAYNIASPYYYYHIFLTAVLLFAAHKEFFLKLTFVFLYFLSVMMKFDATWVLGTYFSSLKNGLPFVPDTLIPVATNIVIFSQVVGSWFLLSRNRLLQRSTLVFFAFFHLYSGLLVYYYYVTTALLPLLVLFGPLYRYTPIPFTRKAAIGWTVIGILALFQIAGFIIPGDRRMTGEANRFGMFMFDANHQCVITASIYTPAEKGPAKQNWSALPGAECSTVYCLVRRTFSTDNTSHIQVDRYESATALYRCDVYEWWSKYHHICRMNPSIERVALTFDHSIDGGPFYRIVETNDICGLEYRAFVHNEWIRTTDQAPIVGYPVLGEYRE